MPFTPKSIVCLREGYDAERIRRDVVAGVTVGMIALPLALAIDRTAANVEAGGRSLIADARRAGRRATDSCSSRASTSRCLPI